MLRLLDRVEPYVRAASKLEQEILRNLKHEYTRKPTEPISGRVEKFLSSSKPATLFQALREKVESGNLLSTYMSSKRPDHPVVNVFRIILQFVRNVLYRVVQFIEDVRRSVFVGPVKVSLALKRHTERSGRGVEDEPRLFSIWTTKPSDVLAKVRQIKNETSLHESIVMVNELVLETFSRKGKSGKKLKNYHEKLADWPKLMKHGWDILQGVYKDYEDGSSGPHPMKSYNSRHAYYTKLSAVAVEMMSSFMQNKSSQVVEYIDGSVSGSKIEAEEIFAVQNMLNETLSFRNRSDYTFSSCRVKIAEDKTDSSLAPVSEDELKKYRDRLRVLIDVKMLDEFIRPFSKQSMEAFDQAMLSISEKEQDKFLLPSSMEQFGGARCEDERRDVMRAWIKDVEEKIVDEFHVTSEERVFIAGAGHDPLDKLVENLRSSRIANGFLDVHTIYRDLSDFTRTESSSSVVSRTLSRGSSLSRASSLASTIRNSSIGRPSSAMSRFSFNSIRLESFHRNSSRDSRRDSSASSMGLPESESGESVEDAKKLEIRLAMQRQFRMIVMDLESRSYLKKQKMLFEKQQEQLELDQRKETREGNEGRTSAQLLKHEGAHSKQLSARSEEQSSALLVRALFRRESQGKFLSAEKLAATKRKMDRLPTVYEQAPPNGVTPYSEPKMEWSSPGGFLRRVLKDDKHLFNLQNELYWKLKMPIVKSKCRRGKHIRIETQEKLHILALQVLHREVQRTIGDRKTSLRCKFDIYKNSFTEIKGYKFVEGDFDSFIRQIRQCEVVSLREHLSEFLYSTITLEKEDVQAIHYLSESIASPDQISDRFHDFHFTQHWVLKRDISPQLKVGYCILGERREKLSQKETFDSVWRQLQQGEVNTVVKVGILFSYVR